MKQLISFLLILLMSSHVHANEPTTNISAQLEHIIELLQGDSRESALDKLKLHEKDYTTTLRETKDIDAYMLLGRAFFYAEMDAKATETFNTALQLDPSLSDAYFFIGRIQGLANDLDSAEASFRNAITIDNNVEQYFLDLGQTLSMKDDRTAAAIAYQNVLALNEESVEANFYLGNFFADEGDTTKAEKYYLASIEHDPNEIDSHYNLGQLYQNTKQHKLAIKHFEKVIELIPNDWQAIQKLVQENEAIKNYAARDAAIGAIYEVWRTNKSEELRQQKFYIREQTELENGKLYALEYFELVGERARKFVFTLHDEETEESKFEVSLGSYDATTNYARSKGSIGPEERRYHLDGYAPNGTHYTYAFFDSIPPYEAVKEIALKKFAGEDKSISSTLISKK